MSCGIEAAVWRNEHVVAELHLGTIENDGVVVGEEVRADFDVIAVIAPEGRQNREVVATCLSEKPPEDLALTHKVGWWNVVELVTEVFRHHALFGKAGIVVRIVNHACEHFLFFCHIDVFHLPSFRGEVMRNGTLQLRSRMSVRVGCVRQ